MSGAVVLAFVAGVCGVLGVWDGLAVLDGRAPLRALERWLAPLRAAGAPTLAERRRLGLVAAATLAASGWLVAGPVLGATLGTLGPAAAKLALRARARRRRADLAAAAPAVARALADAIAAGHSVRGAIHAAARAGGAAPAGAAGVADAALARAARALDVGEPTADVLEGLRRRAQDPAWDTLTAAILLQSEAGGDLAGLLRDLAARLDQHRRDAADARSVTAQARFTAWLVAALPLAAAVMAELASPGFLAGLVSEPFTAALAGLSLMLQLAAIVTVRRIAGAPGNAVR